MSISNDLTSRYGRTVQLKDCGTNFSSQKLGEHFEGEYNGRVFTCPLHLNVIEDATQAIFNKNYDLILRNPSDSTTLSDRKFCLEVMNLYSDSINKIIESREKMLDKILEDKRENTQFLQSFIKDFSEKNESLQQKIHEMERKNLDDYKEVIKERDSKIQEKENRHEQAMKDKDSEIKDKENRHEQAMKDKDSEIKDKENRHEQAMKDKDSEIKNKENCHEQAMKDKDSLLREKDRDYKESIENNRDLYKEQGSLLYQKAKMEGSCERLEAELAREQNRFRCILV